MTPPAPDSHDLMLVRFLVDDAEVAPALWTEWASHRDIDDHTSAAFELFPAAHSRLSALDIDHPWRARLKGVYRRAWVLRQQADAAADAATSTLAGTVPLLRTFDSDLQLHGCDAPSGRASVPRLTVHNADAHRAYATLLNAGWEASSPHRLRHQIVTRVRRFHRGDLTVEVATTPLEGVPHPAYARGVWSRSVATERGSTRSLEDTMMKLLLRESDDRGSLWWAYAVLTLNGRAGRPVDLSATLPPAADLRDVVGARLRMLEQVVETTSADLPCPTTTRPYVGEQDGSPLMTSLQDVAERWFGPRKLATLSRLEMKRRRRDR